jgi:isoamylase
MVFLNGDAIPEPDRMGRRITDDHFLLMFNSHWDPIKFTVPPVRFGDKWRVRLDATTHLVDPPDAATWDADSVHLVEGYSLVVLSTSVVPPEERAAAQSRASKASGAAAKASLQPPPAQPVAAARSESRTAASRRSKR